MPLNRWRTLVGIAVALPVMAQAHNPFAGASYAESPERVPLLLGAVLLLALWAAHCIGARRQPPARSRWLMFQLATLITAATIFGPLDDAAETSTAMHMIQHMLMMVVIPPLLVLAQPLPQWSAALQRSRTRRRRPVLWLPWLAWVRYPVAAAGIHAAVVWFWHIPRLYVLALDHPWWHVVEHACFLFSAGLLWWSVLRSSHRVAPRAMLALLFTLMHTGFLGALLSFADTPFYGEHRSLQDQQLAGLIMWVLGGVPYLSAAVWCGWRWFEQMTRRAPL